MKESGDFSKFRLSEETVEALKGWLLVLFMQSFSLLQCVMRYQSSDYMYVTKMEGAMNPLIFYYKSLFNSVFLLVNIFFSNNEVATTAMEY